jgi:hypothetical protein
MESNEENVDKTTSMGSSRRQSSVKCKKFRQFLDTERPESYSNTLKQSAPRFPVYCVDLP